MAEQPTGQELAKTDTEVGALRRAWLIHDLRRFKFAWIALCAIASLTMGYLILRAVNWVRPDPSWQMVTLWGLSCLLVAMPLIGKLNLSSGGGSMEIVSPLERIDAYEARAAAARTESFEQTRQAISSLSQQIEDLNNELAKLSGQGQATVASSSFSEEPALRDVRRMLPPPTVIDDPQKGRFGGKSSSATRRLTALVERSDIGPSWYRVVLTLASIDNTPIDGAYAYFFLHDTFEPDAYRVKVKPGSQTVRFETAATGAFTAGVFAERGATRLEIDLATSPDTGAPKAFRQS